jgi:glucose-6-phosphate 1-dehydrogenase
LIHAVTDSALVPGPVRPCKLALHDTAIRTGTSTLTLPPKYRNQFLPKDVKIVGYARTKMDHDEYLRRIKSYIKTPTKDIEQQLEEFGQLCTYVSGQYDRDESFQQLNKHLEELEKGRKETHRLFYMALPPSVFTIVSQHLKKCCYPSRGIARVIVCY